MGNVRGLRSYAPNGPCVVTKPDGTIETINTAKKDSARFWAAGKKAKKHRRKR